MSTFNLDPIGSLANRGLRASNSVSGMSARQSSQLVFRAAGIGGQPSVKALNNKPLWKEPKPDLSAYNSDDGGGDENGFSGSFSAMG